MKILIRLAKEIEQDPANANDTLHRFFNAHKFPLVDDQRATFFYWDGSHADGVNLMHWVYGLESRQAFQQIPHTNAFWLTVDLPLSSRVEYKYEVQRNGQSYWMRDPHNAEQACDPFGANSVCAMPGYVDPEWTKTDPVVRKGHVECFSIESLAFHDTREVNVYLPNEHRPRKSYPLLICHDGGDYERYASLITVLDNLIHRQEVAPIIVAMINGHDRNVEYGANSKHPEFIVNDLIPAIEARYNITPGADNKGLMGASFGGVASLFTAWRYPDHFRRLLLQSGSFAFTDIGHHGRSDLWDPVVAFINELREEPDRIKGRVFQSCGVFESLIGYNRTIAPLLRKSGVSLRYIEAKDGHNWINWRDRLRDGLSWLFPGHLWMYYE